MNLTVYDDRADPPGHIQFWGSASLQTLELCLLETECYHKGILMVWRLMLFTWPTRAAKLNYCIPRDIVIAW